MCAPPTAPPVALPRLVMLNLSLCSVWNHMNAFTGFLRFVAARQQQGLVNAFGSQLVPDEPVSYEPQYWQ